IETDDGVGCSGFAIKQAKAVAIIVGGVEREERIYQIIDIADNVRAIIHEPEIIERIQDESEICISEPRIWRQVNGRYVPRVAVILKPQNDTNTIDPISVGTVCRAVGAESYLKVVVVFTGK